MSEQTPLLLNIGDQQHDEAFSQTVEEGNASPAVLQHAEQSSTSSHYLLQLCVIMLIFDFTQYSTYAPLTAVFEDVICTNYYLSTSHSTTSHYRDCKIIPVQRELAIVKGYKDGFNQVPSMLPYAPF